jgi:hypothetical protein
MINLHSKCAPPQLHPSPCSAAPSIALQRVQLTHAAPSGQGVLSLRLRRNHGGPSHRFPPHIASLPAPTFPRSPNPPPCREFACSIWRLAHRCPPHIMRAFSRLTFIHDFVRSGLGPLQVHVKAGKWFHSWPLLSFSVDFLLGNTDPMKSPRSACSSALTPLLQGSQLNRDGVVHVEQQVREFSPMSSHTVQRMLRAIACGWGGNVFRCWPGTSCLRNAPRCSTCTIRHRIPPREQCQYHKYKLTSTQPQGRATHLTIPFANQVVKRRASQHRRRRGHPAKRDVIEENKTFLAAGATNTRTLTHSMGRSRHIFCNAAIRVSKTSAACEPSTQGHATHKAARAEQGREGQDLYRRRHACRRCN